ncbi:EF hand [Phaeobacter sp. CECT 5382]|uniref:EF-hand domain-containing protein n=1 Tax=Phaeobacter sp. CECT 5382 TaxID=1712645 RepID=UPI0006DAD48B|nr:EF-hand domain-containing protein [Phaeobacter sp. CECT 5382]CUH87985.1 EF hand [Phaeobacter sp. CECT 5382]
MTQTKSQIKTIAAIIAAAGVLGATAVMAKPGFGGCGPMMQFEELDADGNGEVTKAEMDAHKAARFKTADSNGDGKLSAEEMLAMAQKRAEIRTQKMIKRFDTDGDGALSESELPKPGRRGDMFKRMDADGSGGISKDEFEEAAMYRGGKRPGRNFGGCPWGPATEQN